MAESDKVANLFEFDAEDSVANRIKAGVFRSFRHYSKQPAKNAKQVRQDIVKSLRSLTDIVALSPGEDGKPSKGIEGKKQQEIEFYSVKQNALVKISHDQATDRLTTKRFAINRRYGLSKDERNENFKNDVTGWIAHALSVVDSEVVKTVLNGIYTTLEKSEDTVGPFIEQFEEHVELFEKLAVIYEHAEEENLTKEKGCYNPALAVDEGMKALGYS